MASIFKPTYTKPIPAEATILTLGGKMHARFKRGSRTVTAPLTKDGTKILIERKQWHVRYRNADGKWEVVAGYTDKKATEQMAAELEVRVARREQGMVDPYEDHRSRPLADHLADFGTVLTAKGNTADYVALVIGRLQALINACGWRSMSDLSLSRAEEWLAGSRTETVSTLSAGLEQYTPAEVAKMFGISLAAVRAAVKHHKLPISGNGKARRLPRATVQALLDRREQGISAQTRNYYRQHLRAFGNWLVKDRRMSESPFRHAETEKTTTDRRYDRRDLTVAELQRLLEAARLSSRTFRGLSGTDRYYLYATACSTGFGAGEPHCGVVLSGRRLSDRDPGGSECQES